MDFRKTQYQVASLSSWDREPITSSWDLHIFIPWSSPPKLEHFKLEKILSECPDELCLGQSLTAYFPITEKESRKFAQ